METWRTFGLLALAGVVAGVAACTQQTTEDSSTGQAVEQAFDRNNVMTDAELLDPEAYSEQQIQRFFEQTPYGKKSALAELTVNGERASTILSKAAATYGVNPLELIVRLQMEQSLVAKTAADKKTLDVAFGCGCPHAPVCKTNPEAYTGFDKQAECAARTLRASMDKLKSGGETVSGWKRMGAKSTEDGVSVTPQTNATAALYSYTPWVGEEGGGKTGVGGMALHHKIWIRFDQAIRGETPNNATPDGGAEEPQTDGGATPKADGGGAASACGAAGCTNPNFPVCDSATNQCVGCLTDSSCSGKGQICDTRLKKCVECTTTNASKCSASGNGLACLSNQTCGCNSDDDCGGGKTCSTTTKKCEAATQTDGGKGPTGEGKGDAGTGETPVDPGEGEQDDGHMTPSSNSAPPPPKVGAPGTQTRGGGEESVEVGNGPDKKKTVTTGCATAPGGAGSSGGFALALGLAVAAVVTRRKR